MHCFDGAVTFGDLERLTDALAATLCRRAFQPGDRPAINLQNVPAFLIVLVGTWRAAARSR